MIGDMLGRGGVWEVRGRKHSVRPAHRRVLLGPFGDSSVISAGQGGGGSSREGNKKGLIPGPEKV